MNAHMHLFKRRMYLLFSLFIFTMANALLAENSPYLMMGTIQFPDSIGSVPSIRVYRGGHKILCETDEDSKKITLTIPREPREEAFYLLVSESIQFHQIEPEQEGTMQNTISYFRVPKGKPYTLYKLTLVCESQEQKEEPLQTYKHLFEKDASEHFGTKSPKKQAAYHWSITQESLPNDSRRIPDNAIIVNYYPTLVETIAGGTKFELPTIKMKNNLLELVGSEKELQELSDSLLLTCLDVEPLHATIQQKVRFGKLHTLVAPTT